MPNAVTMDVSQTEPPTTFSPPQQALWWLKKGALKLGPEWEKAHEICQASEGEAAHDWIHGLCHLIENDPGNAAYWFHRAGRPNSTNDIAVLWQEIAETI
ncbi:hypothetical protein [uncultured Roseibium sp.]|uniref:hypothetical protein n=1 Tax=uncultured Roseibium sp. TaxID=1936171 RepID=UPI0026133D4E|nr:hypothetical protein [uncultured Roseibium sp.]